MGISVEILPKAVVLVTTTPPQADSDLLGGCILRSAIGEVPEDPYQESEIVTTDGYGPFTRKLAVYGITLIALDEVRDRFMNRVAQTIKEIFHRDETMNLELQEEMIKNLYRYKTTIPILQGEDMSFVEDDKAIWSRLRNENTICDYIMDQGEVSGQVMEVVEHLLHNISNVGLHHTFPVDWGLSRRSKLWEAMQAAVENGYYDIAFVEDIDEQSVHDRLILQEFAYWFISTAWNLQESYGAIDEEEWTIKHAAELQAKFPDFYRIYEQTVCKVMVAPSDPTLKIFGPTTTDT